MWHGLSKLRMHTTSTLRLLEEWNTIYGQLARRFQRQTSTIKTFETPTEIAARHRRHEMAVAKSGGALTTSTQSTPKAKAFSLNTFKHHIRTHYVDFIRSMGTSDSYTSAIVGFLAA